MRAFEQGDVETAMALWRQAAADGDSEAYRHLGVEARDGGDTEEARRMFTTACELGNGRAHEQLGGIHYLNGEIDEALRLWRIGASLGDSHSMTLLGLFAEETGGDESGFAWLEQASALGHALASERLAVAAMESGASAAEQERLWRIAADQGSFNGCAMLAGIADVETGSEERIYWADRALACEPPLSDDADVQKARVLGVKGAALMVLGRLDEALIVLEEGRATARTPEVDVDGLIDELQLFLTQGIVPAQKQGEETRIPAGLNALASAPFSGATPHLSEHRFCTQCGQKRIEQAKFCVECGSQFLAT